jgi:predicted RNase H-like HicB family nuclease
MQRNFKVIIEQDADGFFAYVPELKGCHSQGDTHDEARTNVQEAIEAYLESMDPIMLTD